MLAGISLKVTGNPNLDYEMFSMFLTESDIVINVWLMVAQEVHKLVHGWTASESAEDQVEHESNSFDDLRVQAYNVRLSALMRADPCSTAAVPAPALG